MRASRAIIGGAIGLGVAVVLLIGVSRLTEGLTQASAKAATSIPTSGDLGGLGWAPIWLVALGIVVGATVFAARFHYLVAAVPGVLLLLAYLPFVFSLMTASHYPRWLNLMVMNGLGATPYVMSGVLCFASFRAILEQHRAANQAGTQVQQPTQG